MEFSNQYLRPRLPDCPRAAALSVEGSRHPWQTQPSAGDVCVFSFGLNPPYCCLLLPRGSPLLFPSPPWLLALVAPLPCQD